MWVLRLTIQATGEGTRLLVKSGQLGLNRRGGHAATADSPGRQGRTRSTDAPWGPLRADSTG
eukprot:6101077-Alexandrium_andersonii.AAC.1